jgi:glycosyltransferase involved in cell wall biosynthesis
MDNVKVSMIVPAYNEEQEVGRVIAKLKKTLKDCCSEFEVIVVNDASTDGTLAAMSVEGVTVINNEHNLGYGASIKQGLKIARYDWIGIIDADNTYPVEELPLLFERVIDHAMVVGKRKRIVYSKLNWLKQRGRGFFDLLCSYLAGHWIPDINSGLRIFKKALVVPLQRELCDRFSFTTSLTLLMFFKRCPVTYVPVGYELEMINRHSKVKIWKDGYRTLLLVLSLGFHYRPLRTLLLFVVPVAALVLLLRF